MTSFPILQRNPKTGLLVQPIRFFGHKSAYNYWTYKRQVVARNGICTEADAPLSGVTLTVAKGIWPAGAVSLDLSRYTYIRGMDDFKLPYRWAFVKVPEWALNDDEKQIPNGWLQGQNGRNNRVYVTHGYLKNGRMLTTKPGGWGYEYTWEPWDGKLWYSGNAYWYGDGPSMDFYWKLVVGFRDWTAMIGNAHMDPSVPVIFPQFRLYEEWRAQTVWYDVELGWGGPDMWTSSQIRTYN